MRKLRTETVRPAAPMDKTARCSRRVRAVRQTAVLKGQTAAASRQAEVKAAGGVVWRRAGDTIAIAVAHRPRYDDWSLPKGKRQPNPGRGSGMK